jgi:hypothetical protein
MRIRLVFLAAAVAVNAVEVAVAFAVAVNAVDVVAD